MRTRNRAHESFEVSFMQCVLYWFCVFYSLPLLYCVWQRWNWTKRSCVAYWTRLINPPPRVNPWGHVIWQSWTECQYKGDAVLPLLLSLLLSLSEDTLLWYKQRHLPAECGQACEFFLSLCCAAFSTHHQFPRVTGWLRLTSSKTAPLINILAARHYLSTPSMSSGSPFLALGQAPGHASLFEACLLRCSSTRSQNIPWSIIDELGNLLASCKRVIEGSNVATLVHKEQICIQVEHMPKVQSCIHIVKPWNTHTHTHHCRQTIEYHFSALQRSEQQPLKTRHTKGWVDDKKWHFCRRTLLGARNVQLLRQSPWSVCPRVCTFES